MKIPPVSKSWNKMSEGYIQFWRCFYISGIAIAPPHVREVFIYLVTRAHHCNREIYGRVIKRGQCLTSYKRIIESLKWKVGFRREAYSKSQIETAMKWLTKHEMVTTTKTTRGMIVTICNYDKYQGSTAYENHGENYMRTTTKPQQNHTINNTLNELKKKKQYRAAPSYPVTPDDLIFSNDEKPDEMIVRYDNEESMGNGKSTNGVKKINDTPKPPNNDAAIELLNFLNFCCKKKFHHNDHNLNYYCKPRIREHGLAMMKEIVVLKAREFTDPKGNDKDMTKYLRPQTLFGSKNCNNYINDLSDCSDGEWESIKQEVKELEKLIKANEEIPEAN